MVNLVLVISSELEYRSLMWNLNCLTNSGEDYDILCVVTKKSMYLKVRDWLNDNIDRGECLTVYLKPDRVDEIASILTQKNEFTFLVDSCNTVEPRTLKTLLRDYLEKRDAGLIACDRDGDPAYYVKDIYEKYEEKQKIPLKDFAEIDVVSWNGILTKTELLRQYFNGVENYGNLSYSIQLRRLGFSNYVDNKTKLGGMK